MSPYSIPSNALIALYLIMVFLFAISSFLQTYLDTRGDLLQSFISFVAVFIGAYIGLVFGSLIYRKMKTMFGKK